jgi:hypothetical protein
MSHILARLRRCPEREKCAPFGTPPGEDTDINTDYLLVEWQHPMRFLGNPALTK